MRFRPLAVTLAAALGVALAAPRVFAQVRIAVVDLQRAMNETEDGRAAQAKLRNVFKQRQTSLDKRQEELKKMKEDIERQREVLSREALGKRLEDYQKQFVDLQTVYMDYQRELAQQEGELTKRILDRMQEILRRMGQREGYTLIVERNEGGVVWAPTDLDLTDRVIQAYNAGEGAPPAAAGGAKNKNKNR